MSFNYVPAELVRDFDFTQPCSQADGGVHVLPLTVYWNHPPPSGSTTFPVGTIIS